MPHRSRPLAALTLIVLLSAAGAGCGDSLPAAETQTGATSSATKRTASDESRAKSVRFAACMREHGIDDFPDPSSSAELTADEIANHTSIDTTGPAWSDATQACKDLQPDGFTGHTRSAAQQASALKFAQCVRENGVADFPDPGPDDPLIDTNRIPSAEGKGGLEIPGLQAAMDACGGIYADELGLNDR